MNESNAPSPFATPATTQSAPPPANNTPEGDTSYLDNVTAQEPLIKSCVVPGVITAYEAKTSAESGNPFINRSVQLYGEKMVFSNGDPVPQGKRLSATLFLSAKDEEKFKRTARALKNEVLALNNIPLDANADKAYAALPPAQKVAVTRRPDGSLAASPSAFTAQDRVGTKVLVEIRQGKDMDGNPRNEFNLLAASTPQKASR